MEVSQQDECWIQHVNRRGYTYYSRGFERTWVLPAGEEFVPSDWSVHQDDSGAWYMYNVSTSESCWIDSSVGSYKHDGFDQADEGITAPIEDREKPPVGSDGERDEASVPATPGIVSRLLALVWTAPASSDEDYSSEDEVTPGHESKVVGEEERVAESGNAEDDDGGNAVSPATASDGSDAVVSRSSSSVWPKVDWERLATDFDNAVERVAEDGEEIIQTLFRRLGGSGGGATAAHDTSNTTCCNVDKTETTTSLARPQQVISSAASSQNEKNEGALRAERETCTDAPSLLTASASSLEEQIKSAHAAKPQEARATAPAFPPPQQQLEASTSSPNEKIELASLTNSESHAAEEPTSS